MRQIGGSLGLGTGCYLRHDALEPDFLGDHHRRAVVFFFLRAVVHEGWEGKGRYAHGARRGARTLRDLPFLDGPQKSATETGGGSQGRYGSRLRGSPILSQRRVQSYNCSGAALILIKKQQT